MSIAVLLSILVFWEMHELNEQLTKDCLSAVEEEAHAQVRLYSAHFCSHTVASTMKDFFFWSWLALIIISLIGWSEKGERWGRGPSKLSSPPWLCPHMLPTTRPPPSPPCVKSEASGAHINLRQLVQDLLDDRLFIWDYLDSLFLIPQLLSFVLVYTLIKGFGLNKKTTCCLLSEYKAHFW